MVLPSTSWYGTSASCTARTQLLWLPPARAGSHTGAAGVLLPVWAHQSGMGARSALVGPAGRGTTKEPQFRINQLNPPPGRRQGKHAPAGAYPPSPLLNSPLMTLPLQSKCEPWQGQSKVFSSEFHCGATAGGGNRKAVQSSGRQGRRTGRAEQGGSSAGGGGRASVSCQLAKQRPTCTMQPRWGQTAVKACCFLFSSQYTATCAGSTVFHPL